VSLPWVRLDTQIATNPKILVLTEQKQYRALWMYTCALGYSGAHGTDGYIPAASLVFIHGTKRDAEALVSVGLWRPTTGGYDINDWADYQQSGQELSARRTRAQAAAMMRWHPETKG
jgi:hypothetical protein